MLTPEARALVTRYERDGRVVLRRSWKVGVVALAFTVAFVALFVDLIGSSDPRPGYLGVVIFSPLLVMGLVLGVRQLLPGGSVVVDAEGIHLSDRDVAWSAVRDLSVQTTSGWRGYRYVRIELEDESSADLPLMLTPGAHDQWFALSHLRESHPG
ncbi:hypothetical protein [Nocardioides daejeonensis]|uniref:hypothetical protein n=1 Tax=Nocardioides daejeonensis TaxID=1046556 RepID=UPI000D744A61|nr:hypothetical protein [Nocardioides daejeonensis]